jgi:hypothetical protein
MSETNKGSGDSFRLEVLCGKIISHDFGEIEIPGTKIKLMPNGELRTQMTFGEFSTTVTRSSLEAELKWQNPHYHKGLMETTIVLRGWVACASLVPEFDVFTVKIHFAGEDTSVIATMPGHEHSMVIAPGSVTQTTKHGIPAGNPDNKGNDWWTAEVLADLEVCSLGVRDIARMTGIDIKRLRFPV